MNASTTTLIITTNFHEFTFDLHTDPEGNFYFIKGGPVRPGGSGWDKITPHHGCLFKVSKDGSKLEVVARGFRAPERHVRRPQRRNHLRRQRGDLDAHVPDQLDQAGRLLRRARFRRTQAAMPTIARQSALLAAAQEVDNSNGGQVWITSDKFGPLSGQLMHTSYGTVHALPRPEGRSRRPDARRRRARSSCTFDSGICRARFNEKQNALYLTGSARLADHGAEGRRAFIASATPARTRTFPSASISSPAKIKLTFSDPLDKSIAQDADNYNLEQWNYRWTGELRLAAFQGLRPEDRQGTG